MLNVTFFGVRGSTPCAGPEVRRYGGNTSCVALESPGAAPILLDIGTGLRYFGKTQPTDGSFRGAALISHLHWDHVQGLPFFVPILRPGAELDILGPIPDDGTLADSFDSFMRQPFFPVTVGQLPGEIRIRGIEPGWHDVYQARVLALEVPHTGRTFGFRVEMGGASVAYIPDHQQPYDGGYEIADAVVELAHDVDVLIHDAQYLAPEFALKATWGHCTYEYALAVGLKAKARSVALFHHDPGRDDDALDEVTECARVWGAAHGIEVFSAKEGLTVSLG